MAKYFLQRSLFALVLLILASMTSFFIIQLPSGDFLDTYVTNLRSSGQVIDQSRVDALRHQYGLDQPIYTQYWLWISGMPFGDFGFSFAQNRPVKDMIGERLGYSVMLSFLALIVSYGLAIPIGIYSATHQYSWGDYVATFIGFIGLAVPGFLLALIVVFFAFRYLGLSPGGLFSPKYLTEPWSWGKFLDMLAHLPVPVIIIGLAGTAGTIRVMRATLLDELRKPYVLTARSKGLTEMKLLFKYPVRFALNPMASTIFYIFPLIVSGETLTSIVLNLPSVGPMLLVALQMQDMYLAGTLIMFLTFMTIVGMFASELLLAWLDPRIRYE